MNTAMQKTFAIAGLAIAALPVLAAAGMAAAQPATVRISDLDLSSPAHVQAFDQRIDQAADRLCDGVAPRDTGAMRGCRRAVRAEVFEKLAAARSQAEAENTRALIIASR